MTTTNRTERMDQGFAVFNLHVNDAGDRADREFIAQFGQDEFDKVIKPLHDAGIMSIFDNAPTPQTQAWVSLVTAFVNEKVKPEPVQCQQRVTTDAWDFDGHRCKRNATEEVEGAHLCKVHARKRRELLDKLAEALSDGSINKDQFDTNMRLVEMETLS